MIDFGLAQKFQKGDKKMDTKAGTVNDFFYENFSA
jgi:hypothetical protein